MGATTQNSRAATAAPPVRIGVIGVGRIGSMHADLLARRVPGAAVAAFASATAATVVPSTWRASSSACMRPIRPTPITPTRTVVVLVACTNPP